MVHGSTPARSAARSPSTASTNGTSYTIAVRARNAIGAGRQLDGRSRARRARVPMPRPRCRRTTAPNRSMSVDRPCLRRRRTDHRLHRHALHAGRRRFDRRDLHDQRCALVHRHRSDQRHHGVRLGGRHQRRRLRHGQLAARRPDSARRAAGRRSRRSPPAPTRSRSPSTSSTTAAPPITAYEYQLDGGDWVVAPTTTSPFIIGGLTTGTQYSVKIRATNAGRHRRGLVGGERHPAHHARHPDRPERHAARPPRRCCRGRAPTSDGGQPITDYVVQWATTLGRHVHDLRRRHLDVHHGDRHRPHQRHALLLPCRRRERRRPGQLLVAQRRPRRWRHRAHRRSPAITAGIRLPLGRLHGAVVERWLGDHRLPVPARRRHLAQRQRHDLADHDHRSRQRHHVRRRSCGRSTPSATAPPATASTASRSASPEPCSASAPRRRRTASSSTGIRPTTTAARSRRTT